MTNQQLAEQKRLEEILKLARMQLNEEYMKKHSVAHTTWLNSARTAWSNSGVLLPFSTKFVYPSEEEVVARGVEIYNTLTLKNEPATVASAPIVEQTVPVEQPIVVPELLQAAGDFVIAEIVKEPAEELVEAVEAVDEVTDVEAVEEVTDVEVKEEIPLVTEPTIVDSLLENKFKSLFTKWGGKGNY